MQNKLELSLLIDYYGAFLTDNQCEMLKLNCEEDFSLAEIAEQKGISRQGVRDALQRGEKILLEMEEKLGLAARDRRSFRQRFAGAPSMKPLGKESTLCYHN